MTLHLYSKDGSTQVVNLHDKFNYKVVKNKEMERSFPEMLQIARDNGETVLGNNFWTCYLQE